MVARTPSGEIITCDGCGAVIEEVRDDMTFPVLYPHQWSGTDTVYIVCGPLPDNTQPCLDAARRKDEEFEIHRCRKPGCTGPGPDCTALYEVQR